MNSRIQKKRVLALAIALLGMSVVLPHAVAMLQASTPASHTSGQIKSFTVIVSKAGFNGTDKTLFLNLTQGDAVHITFLYGDSELSYDNPHVVFLQGYDLRTGVISDSNPSATMDFVATKTGTFAFYCLVACEGMLNLSSGAIVVQSRPKAAVLTTLDIKLDRATVQGHFVNVMAVLTQGSGSVSNVRVDFYVSTAFGPMRVGTAVTDEDGVARFNYRFTRSGKLAILAAFAGTESLAPSDKRLDVLVEPRSVKSTVVDLLPAPMGESVPTPPYALGQNQIPDIRVVGAPTIQSLPVITFVLMVVGSVWVAYGYVFAQIRAIKRASSPQHDRKKGSVEKAQSALVEKFDKRILAGIVLAVLIAAGAFVYYQVGQPIATQQGRTETISIDIKMTMQNDEERHVFDPATITAHKGNHVILIVTNTDKDATHGLVIPELDLNTGALSPGQQAKVEFDAETAGTFTILCSVPACAPDHARMIAQLVVEG